MRYLTLLKKTEYSGLTGTTLCAAVVFVVSPGSQKKWSLFNTCKHFKRASKCTSSVLCNVEMQMHYLSLNINSAQLYFNITEYLCLLFSGIHITPLKAWSHMHSSPNPHHTDRFVQYNAFWKRIWHSFRSLHFLRTTHTQNIARVWIADEIFGVFVRSLIHALHMRCSIQYVALFQPHPYILWQHPVILPSVLLFTTRYTIGQGK